MMRFRRRGFSRKGRREPLMWDRTLTNLPVAAGTTGGNVIFDPTLITAGVQDLRVTVRRIRLSLVVVQGGLVANNTYQTHLGIYVGRTGEALHEPSLVTSALAASPAAERTDWMWLGSATGTVGPAGNNLIFNGADNVLDGSDRISVRANRKLNQDDLVIMVAQTIQLTGALAAINAPTLVTRQSVLYSRTRR